MTDLILHDFHLLLLTSTHVTDLLNSLTLATISNDFELSPSHLHPLGLSLYSL